MSNPHLINIENLGPLVKDMVEQIIKNRTTRDIFKVQSKRKGVGDVLRSLRLARRMTMADLAEQIGISASYISRIESGTRRINMDLINAFCKFYEITPAELMESVPEPCHN